MLQPEGGSPSFSRPQAGRGFNEQKDQLQRNPRRTAGAFDKS